MVFIATLGNSSSLSNLRHLVKFEDQLESLVQAGAIINFCCTIS